MPNPRLLPLVFLAFCARPDASSGAPVDGDLDSAFRDGGKFVYAADTLGGRACDVDLEGRLLIGYTAVLSGTDKDLRLLPVPDEGFVTQCGSYAPDFGGTDEDILFDVAASGTRVYVAGSAAPAPDGNGYVGLAIGAISLSNCQVDPAFGGTDGYTWHSTVPVEARAIAATPAGKVRLAARYGPGPGAVQQMHSGGLDTAGIPDGDVDQEFVSYVGIGADSFEPHALTRQPDGKILIAGTVVFPGGDRDVGVVRFEADGDLDPTWSVDGLTFFSYLTTDLGDADEGYAIAVLHDGRVAVAGGIFGGAGSRAGVALLTSTGGLDSGFGDGGRFAFVFANSAGTRLDTLRAVAVQGDSKIVVAGRADLLGDGDGGAFGVARLLDSGAAPFDTSFDDDGRKLVDFDEGGDFTDEAWDLTLGQGGKISVVGEVAEDELTAIGAARLWNAYVFVDGFEFGSHGFWSVHNP